MRYFAILAIPLMLFVALFSEFALARMDIPQDHLALPVLISLKGDGSASGFFMSSANYVYLVTASHVLFKKDSQQLKSSSATLLCWTTDPKNPKRISLKLNLSRLFKDGSIRPSESGDVTVIRCGMIQKKEGSSEIVTQKKYVQWIETSQEQIQGVNVGDTKKFDDVLVSNEVYVFGYPISLGIQESPQFDYQRPLLRKGIIAGKNPLQRTIILDCPSYYGNSGGPVVQAERLSIGRTEFKVIGIVSQFIPFKETWVNVTHKLSHWEISNSGYSVVIPIDRVLELIDKHETAEPVNPADPKGQAAD
jgi:S1-C subfamily serine protease